MNEPETVPRPVMLQRWENLAFLHWSFPVDEVQRLLPAGFEVEPWDGRAWVSLIPFRMSVRPPRGPAIPGLTTFPETNLRTYINGPDGRPGVWFFSLEAANLAAVAAARVCFGLPYHVAKMTVTRDGGTVRYLSKRIRIRGGRAFHDIEVEVGGAIPPSELGEFDHYLTARFRLWSVHAGVVLTATNEHPPWRLRLATVTRLEENLLEHAGLPRPTGDPVVHFADAMDTRIGGPHVVRVGATG